MPERLRDRDAVLRAIAEYDSIRQAAFLDRYGFRPATKYLLRLDGREYDTKAIVGVAYGFEHPEHGPLRSSELSGGLGPAEAAGQLRALGFEIFAVSQRNPVLGPVPAGPAAALMSGTRLRSEDLEADRSLGTSAGLYAWFGDEQARRLVYESLGVEAGELLYVGQAGATKWPSGTESKATLGSRIRGQHFGGNSRSSTLRRTFAAALGPSLGLQPRPGGGLDPDSEKRLSTFMRSHLRVALFEIAERGEIGTLEAEAVRVLNPPLNLDHVPRTDARRRLAALRRDLRLS